MFLSLARPCLKTSSGVEGRIAWRTTFLCTNWLRWHHSKFVVEDVRNFLKPSASLLYLLTDLPNGTVSSNVFWSLKPKTIKKNRGVRINCQLNTIFGTLDLDVSFVDLVSFFENVFILKDFKTFSPLNDSKSEVFLK